MHVYLIQHAIDLSAIDASIFLYNLMSVKDAEDISSTSSQTARLQANTMPLWC
jgi:hypothetical protein